MKLFKVFAWIVVSVLILAACKSTQPNPGAVFSGTIAMGGNAKSASITLKVSEDGNAIVSVGGNFTEITCDGFSAGSWSSSSSGFKAPITDGKFEVKSSIGVISGQFTSPTDAQGTIQMLIDTGFGGSIDCGTYKWSTKGK